MWRLSLRVRPVLDDVPMHDLLCPLSLSASPKPVHAFSVLMMWCWLAVLHHIPALGCYWVLTSPPVLLARLTKHLVANPFFPSASCQVTDCTPPNVVRVWFVVFGVWLPCQLVPKGSAGLLSHPMPVLGSVTHLAASSSSAQPIRARPGESDIWQEKGNLGQA